MRTTRRRGKTNPHCVTNKAIEQQQLVSLDSYHENNAEGEGLHCISPEEYFIWVESMQEPTSQDHDELYYWE